MSTDNGVNSGQPEGPGTPTSQGGTFNQDVSRRKFLRAAVVGTAGVAGAAGVAGIVLHNSTKPSMSNLGVYTGISTDPGYGYLEPTEQDYDITQLPTTDTVSGKKVNYTSSFWLALGIPNLDVGTYNVYVQQEVGTQGYLNIYPQLTGKNTSPDNQPFAYNTNGNNVQVFTSAANTIGTTGPYSFTKTETPVAAASSADPGGALQFVVSSSATPPATTMDVRIFVHLSWGAAAPTTTETVYLKFTVTNVNTGKSSSFTATITANPA